ncbi:uncharacterized protein TM35_000111860 [Trypanosoma theileri]|uniref:Uncharacterized protein n=1 Tax=Trypanosoma theileri TaxID=67003 RepID=A0A1X0NY98_9TRYP|nr:uncharacterized protein TM35_000111860 [Trypanosoma theileri]ORC89652.1 hypothetical protein TM35_000111860 [Trypanosoma theileri]
MAKGKKKETVDVFARLGSSRQFTSAGKVDPSEVRPAELLDTAITIAPAIPRVEVSLSIQFRCPVPLIEGDILQLYLPGFRGRASLFTPESPLMQNMTPVRDFQGYWSGDGMKKSKGPGKQTMLLKCVRRVDAEQLVLITIPRTLGLIGPDKLALNSAKLKISGTVAHAEGGKILKQAFMSTTEIKKRPVIDEIVEYRTLISSMDQTGGLEEANEHVAEELSLEEVDQLWEAAHERCPYPIGLQWHIAVAAFHSYETYGPLLKTIVENAIGCVKKRNPLGLQTEIAKNYGIKVGAVVLFQDVLSMLYGSMYPDLPSSVLLAVRLFTMEPIDIARTFLVNDPPQVSLAQEIFSSFRTGNTENLTKWAYTVSTLILICGVNTNGMEPALLGATRPVLYYGIKELPQDELQYIRGLQDDDWYMFPSFSMVRPNVNWTDEEAFQVPDNAVLFEISNVVDGLEVCDVSMYPYDREWLLPLCSSFRVRSVKTYDDRNGLTHVTLEMYGCLYGVLRDSMIPEEDRTVIAVVAKKIRTDAEKSSSRVRYIAEHAYLNVKLNERLRLYPQTLLRVQYVEHYFEVKRNSQAKASIEEGIVNWQVCTTPVQMIDPVEGVIKHAAWESMPRKFALITEQCFLSRTRVKKVFDVSGIILDFATYLCDYSGKGPRPMRRLVRKRVSHEAPLPVLPEVVS